MIVNWISLGLALLNGQNKTFEGVMCVLFFIMYVSSRFVFNEDPSFCKDKHGLSVIPRDLHHLSCQPHCAMSTDSWSVQMYSSVFSNAQLLWVIRGTEGGEGGGSRADIGARGESVNEAVRRGEAIGSQRGGPLQRACGGRRLHYLQF